MDQVTVTVLDPTDPLCISTAIYPIKLIDDVRLFPNPSNGSLTLELDTSQAREVRSMEILDAMGRARVSLVPHIIDGTLRLDLPSALANGTYALRIISNAGSRTSFFELLR